MSGITLPITWDQATDNAFGALTATNNGALTDIYTPYNAGIIQDVSASTIGSDPPVSSTINCFVSPDVGTLSVPDISANYNLQIGQSQNQSQESLSYDNIFDVILSLADSVAFLNAFTVSGLALGLPSGVSDQLANGASCTFSSIANDAVDLVLQKIINEATDASGHTAAQFLGESLNKVLSNYNISAFRTAFLTQINSVAQLTPSDITLGLEVDSGVVNIDVPSSSQSVVSTCYGGVPGGENSKKLINQIDLTHLNAYADSLNNTINTSAFPAVPGDQIVFGLKNQTPFVTIRYNAVNSSAPTRPSTLNLDWQPVIAGYEYGPAPTYNISDNAWTLAFRITLSGEGVSYTVSTTGAAAGTGLLPTQAWIDQGNGT